VGLGRIIAVSWPDTCRPRLAVFASLVAAGKIAEFIAQCGTHFIRAVSKRSGLRVTFSITNLSENSKRLISSHFDSTASANATFQAISADAKASLSADIADTLKLASNFGKVTYDVQATGGLGIPTLGKTLKAANLTNVIDLQKVLDAISEAAADFTRANASPDKFLLVPHPQLKPSDYKFDGNRYEVLGKLYKAILRVDEQAELYSNYRTMDATLWSKYFRVYSDKVVELRTSLLRQYTSCRDRGVCDGDIPTSVDGLILEDITFDGQLRASCPLGNSQKISINPKTASSVQYISAVIIDWAGRLRFFSAIDLNGAEVYRVTPSLTLEKLPFDLRKQITTNPDPKNDDQVRALIALAYFPTDVSKAVVNGDVDANYLNDKRRDAARSIYLIRLPLRAGFQVEEVFGFPDMNGCKIMTGG
jgi:hypothetical protein